MAEHRTPSSRSTVARPMREPLTAAPLIAALVLGTVGCAGTQTMPSGWREPRHVVEGPHFTLYTDLERRVAEATLRDLERVLAASLKLGWRDRKSTRLNSSH